jgi:hypothetical protein
MSGMATKPSQPISLFYCYSHKDRTLRDKLDGHLSILRRTGLITAWYDGEILPGTSWEQEIEYQLNTAQIILLLVSVDFIQSDYCYSKEMKRAIARHSAKKACVIPVLLRPVDWTGAPFSSLQMLPSNATPVTNWSDLDEALTDVAEGIRRVVTELLGPDTMIQQAQQELKSVHPQRTSQEKYNVQIGEAKGVIIGDGTQVVQHFGSE